MKATAQLPLVLASAPLIEPAAAETPAQDWRALSLTGPWWWFMLYLPPEYLKDIENRVEGFSHKSFRGDFFLHAAKGMRYVTDYAYAVNTARRLGVPEEALAKVPSFDMLPRGGIVGRARITDIVPPGNSGRLWHFPNQWGFVVVDAQPLPFVPCSGLQGFWRVKPATLDALRAKGAAL